MGPCGSHQGEQVPNLVDEKLVTYAIEQAKAAFSKAKEEEEE